MSLYANTRFGFSVLTCAVLLHAQNDSPVELMCESAANGKPEAVRAMLIRGANPDELTRDGDTALTCAVSLRGRKGDTVGALIMLIDHHADPNARDRNGRTPLLAAMQGSASEYKIVPAAADAARLLLERGAQVNVRDKEGWTPLLLLLSQWAENPGLVKLLLDKGADVNARRDDGVTPLVFAVRRPSLEFAQLLVDKGARIDTQDERGATPLMMAVAGTRGDTVPMIEFLLSHGANPNLRDHKGQSAVDYAIAGGFPDRVGLLLGKGAQAKDRAAALQSARDRALVHQVSEGANKLDARSEGGDPNAADELGHTVLMLAAGHEFGDPLVKLLLERGAQVNVRDPGGNAALMFAADEYLPAVVRLLLDKGADVNARDKDGNTVLLRAAASRRSWHEEKTPLFAMLLAAGADPKPANSHGITALMHTAQEGNSGLLDLLERKVEVDARDAEGNTALLYAAKHFVRGGSRAAGRALLAAGADVNAANQAGETPLIRAATQYEAECAQILIDAGAKLNAGTKQGRTALMAAIDGPKDFDNTNHVVYSPAIAKLLIARGADVNARDAQGRTALMLATARGHSDIIPLLLEKGAAATQ